MCHGWKPLERGSRIRLVVPTVDDLFVFGALGALHLVDATALTRLIVSIPLNISEIYTHMMFNVGEKASLSNQQERT